MKNKITILGTRGIPANHGGFETFAEKLSLFLVKRGWQVTVLCQIDGEGKVEENNWENIKLIKIPISIKGSIGTILFDLKSVLITRKASEGIILTLGYNTALFNILLKKKPFINIINMDGIEWKRRKYNYFQRLWLLFNEKIASRVSDHLVADNPAIKDYLETKIKQKNKITMIPYGAETKNISEVFEKNLLKKFNLNKPHILIVGRPVEENNIYEIVKAFSKKNRSINLVILGQYNKSVNYQKKVLNIASEEVIFLGAIYDDDILSVLRSNAKLYIHGHSVGGTNPALVEAMSYGIPILAHDNPYNRWVAGTESEFFANENDLEDKIESLIIKKDKLNSMSKASLFRYNKYFSWEKILNEYENLLLSEKSRFL